jgi:hypothetical protein
VAEMYRHRCILQIVTAELQTANVAYFQRRIQQSGWLAVPVIQISGVLLYWHFDNHFIYLFSNPCFANVSVPVVAILR